MYNPHSLRAEEFINHAEIMDTLEYAIVPMVFRSLKIADELAASAIVRGIESPYKKESYYVSRIAALDCFLIVVSVGAAVCCCLL